MDRKSQEYGYLKQEILDSIGYTKQYRSILYTVTAAILTFAFTQKEPIIFLLPIVVIIPTYLLQAGQTSSTLRIGAYIMVFIETDEPGWETRLAKYDEKFSPENPSVSPHIFISVCCFCLCIFNLDYSNFLSKETIIRLIVAIIYLIVCVIILSVKKVDYGKEKKKYIDEWKEIKGEEKNKRKNRK